MNKGLTDIKGILVGHATDMENQTGCTAVLCPEGFTPGLYVPGFAPGSRETELLRPESSIDVIHGLLLTGGSAFGLAAADGVVTWLQERGYGLKMPHARIPLVPAAVIYDLDLNKEAGMLPNAAMGYQAAENASDLAVLQGSLGAATSARCGRLGKPAKGGIGTYTVRYKDIIVSALVVVNALGNIHDPETGAWLQGTVDSNGHPITGSQIYSQIEKFDLPRSNTVLTVVATNAKLDKVQTSRLARMAASGLARVIKPAHLLYDGDIVFALSSKQGQPANENILGAMGADAVSYATVNWIK